MQINTILLYVDLISCLVDIIVISCGMDLNKSNKPIKKPTYRTVRTTQPKLDKQLQYISLRFLQRNIQKYLSSGTRVRYHTRASE